MVSALLCTYMDVVARFAPFQGFPTKIWTLSRVGAQIPGGSLVPVQRLDSAVRSRGESAPILYLESEKRTDVFPEIICCHENNSTKLRVRKPPKSVLSLINPRRPLHPVRKTPL